jgi:glutamate-5-semialdehyde dehydrogenase
MGDVSGQGSTRASLLSQGWHRQGAPTRDSLVDVQEEVLRICARARAASRVLALSPRAKKDEALAAIARGVEDGRQEVLAANRVDVEAAAKAGAPGAMIDRLRLDEGRLAAVAEAVRSIADLEDPVGTVIERQERPNGLVVTRVRAPLGVVAMIYEARPNVTVEASALCLKAGSAVVLRGGTEASRSNAALAAVIGRALEACGLPRDAVAVLPFTDRDAIKALVASPDVDLAIPRGGEALIRFVTEHARVPVVQHYKGVCHLFVDAGADVAAATDLAVNAKLSRPGVCNALECLLVDGADAARVLPSIAARLIAGGCELRGDARSREIVPAMKAATEDDYGREFLDAILAVRVVDGLDGALAHIARYGSGHTEAICTPNGEHASRFQREVDAACVVVNASTRFHDGGELGLGAELGIATSRLHWRGPMGLEALTTMKWLVLGEGQIRR